MKHLLLVEDEAGISEGIVELLDVFGYRTDLTESAEAAIVVLEDTTNDLPDAILTDVKLPGMSGLELIQTILTNPKWQTIPIICLSASLPPEIEDLLAIQAHVAFIGKPFEIDDLVKMIEQITSR